MAAAKAKSEPSESENVRLTYDELLASRDRLAGLPPLSREDFNDIELALHEVVFYCLTVQ